MPSLHKENNVSDNSLYSLLHSPVLSSLLDQNIFLSTLFSNTLAILVLLQTDWGIPKRILFFILSTYFGLLKDAISTSDCKAWCRTMISK
jgi:hypothetical protein